MNYTRGRFGKKDSSREYSLNTYQKGTFTVRILGNCLVARQLLWLSVGNGGTLFGSE